MKNGEIWWVDFQEPRGSAPAFIRPAIVIQNNELNDSQLRTTSVIPITTNTRLADYRGNVFLDKKTSNLTKDSVALCAQITTVDKMSLLEKASTLNHVSMLEIKDELMWIFSL